MKTDPNDYGPSRAKQIAVGALLISSVGLLAIFCWLCRAMPGIAGEWFGIVAGVVSTPFLMEGSFVVMGFMLVLGLNHWRQKRDVDEFVDLAQFSDPNSRQSSEPAETISASPSACVAPSQDPDH